VAAIVQSAPREQVSPAAQAKRIIPSRYQVGLVTVLGAIFLVALAPKLDTDLWWHLKDGQYILAHHAVATRDYLSFTFAGHPWTDHEWLADLFLYTCYRLAGLWGTIVAFAAIICATFGLVYARMARVGTNRMLALFVLCAAFMASSATWGARPQMITLLFLALYALTLDRWLVTRDRRLLAVFPLTMLLWTNLHGGWVLGLVLLTITLAGEWLNRVTHHDDALAAADLRALAATIVLTLLATLLNPAGLGEVLYPLVWIFPSPYSNVLTEWVSSDFHQPVTMVFEGMLLTLIAAFFIGRPRLNWTHLLLILAFTHLALSQSRNVAVWSVLISPLLAVYLQSAFTALRPATTARSTTPLLRPRTERTLNLTLLLLASALYLVETFHFVNAQALRRSEAAAFPAGATHYLQTHRLPPRTFTSYAWGGYLLWQLYPHYRDFIDGRANTLFDARILHDYLTASTAAPGWQTVLRRYRIQNVLIEPRSPLAQLLAASPAWRLAYHDRTAVLFTRSL
jgi:hypothetical protein